MDKNEVKMPVDAVPTSVVAEQSKPTALDEYEKKLNKMNSHALNREKNHNRHMAKVLAKRRAAAKVAKKARKRNRTK